MAIVSIPTSADIYIEVNGQKIAAAQNYKVKSSKESKYLEAFGSVQPIGTVGGRVKHWVELARVCISNSNADVDFYDLSGFNIVIAKPYEKIIYSGCEWVDIIQSASVNEVVLEKVSAVAASRLVLRS